MFVLLNNNSLVKIKILEFYEKYNNLFYPI